MSEPTKPDPMNVLDSHAEMVAMFVGMRAMLVAEGFTQAQASDLVVEQFRLSVHQIVHPEEN